LSHAKTFKVLFYLKRDKQKASGMISLFCRITVDEKEARFGMKCKVTPNYRDMEAGRATGRTADAVKTNALVENTKAAIYKIYGELQERDSYVTAEKIKSVFTGIEARRQILLELFDTHNCDLKLQIDINLSKSTFRKYCTVRRTVAGFIPHKYSLHDIPLREVNLQFPGDLEVYPFANGWSKTRSLP
jgi:hypothetical protein